jgi:hypothetical protein
MRRLLSFIVLPVFGAVAFAAIPPAEPQQFLYNISRNGSPIGRHMLEIEKKGDVTSVTTTSEVLVKLLFIPAYTYRYTGNETWAQDQLTAFSSQTDDNGTAHRVILRPNGDKLQLDADGRQSIVDKTIGLDDFWTPQLLTKTTVLDTSTGQEKSFIAKDLGMEMINYRGAPRPAHHFKLTGGINQDLWFDAADAPVRFQLKGTDGSTIVSELQ